MKYAIHKKTKTRAAIKMYDRSKMKESYVKRAFAREVEIMRQLEHQNIVKLIQVIEDKNNINLVMEHVSGVSLQ